MKMNCLDVGQGATPLVLLHGFPFSAELWRPQLEALGPQARIVAPDLRGFGGSALPAGPYTIAQLADDVAETLDALKIGRAVIGGLSMGGYVAFEFYRRHAERTAALVLADTKPEPDSPEGRAGRARMAELARQDGVRAVVDQLLPKLLAVSTRAERPEVERSLRAMMESATPEAIVRALDAMANRQDSRRLLPTIGVPVLAITGAEDALAPPDQVRAWAAAIPGARVEIVADAGHVSNLEQPERFSAALRAFLESGPVLEQHMSERA